MKIVYLALVLALFTACGSRATKPQIEPIEVVLVEGGFIAHPLSNFYGTQMFMQSFYIGKFEVTQAQWQEVMGENPSFHQGEGLNPDVMPVESISWYDAIIFLNKRSEMEGFEPVYIIDKTKLDPNNLTLETADFPESEFLVDNYRWSVTTNPAANGYRLPTELEWEYAAGGGQLTQGFEFSGSNDISEVAWFFRTSGDEYLDGLWHSGTLEANNGRTHPVGQKKSNELGIYDMSGNVREWVWEWNGNWFVEQDRIIVPESGDARVVRGGSWVSGEDATRFNFRGSGIPPHLYYEDLGLRVVRNGPVE
ncbi:UNVERIFIED_CONTAM: formylglycine-generating enzyme required for sulfatase activity [Acetivibrio alkalicellulosi]